MTNLTLENKKKVIQAAKLIKKSRRILFVTGAGISADSGLPTYRGIGGIYDNQNTKDGIPIEQALSGEAIKTCPDITWKYMAQIEKKCRNTKPNRAHQVIADLEKKNKEVWIFTQNLDAFHQQAGSSKVIDIHGDIHKLRCCSCNWRAEISDYSGLVSFPPPCPECNSYLRPDVVFFGEALPLDKLRIFQQELTKGFDLYFSVGTTATFPYVLEPLLLAKKTHKPLIEINPGQTAASSLADIQIGLGASDALSLIQATESIDSSENKNS